MHKLPSSGNYVTLLASKDDYAASFCIIMPLNKRDLIIMINNV